MDELAVFRQKIDDLDSQLVSLLNQRAALAQQVGQLKEKTDAPVFRPEREAQILRRMAEDNPGPLKSADVQAIFREIMSSCRALERRIVVAFLGPAGTFSEQAVYRQFGHAVQTFPCTSIDEVFRATEAGTVDYGVIPLENSTEGVVNRSLDLLLTTPLLIGAEVSIAVHHNLMTRSGLLEGVTSVCAHQQALAQCQDWLSQNHPQLKRVAVSSNAEGARLAKADPTVAAIASDAAAREYDLQIISFHIQDDPNNRTRFAMLGKNVSTPSGNDQTSLILAVPNKPGAVYQLLEPLARNGVSMTRFESRPAKTGAWEYYFYVDIRGHKDEPHIAAALAELQGQSAFFKLLGAYPFL